MRYMVVIEEGPASFGAYVLDLPGCIAAGESAEEVLQIVLKVIVFNIKNLKIMKKVRKSRCRIVQCSSVEVEV